MRVRDKDRQRRMSRDEREARKRKTKRLSCKHLKRKPVEQGKAKCMDCGELIKQG